MGKLHLIRLASPKTWDIKRKGAKFVTKPLPGSHKAETGMAVSTMLKEVFGYASSTREAKKILQGNRIKIDGKVSRNSRSPVGLFDTIEFQNLEECFRIVFTNNGKIDIVKIRKDESSIKPCKIVGKTMVKGKLQLNLYDGRNIFVDKNSYKVGDTVVISLPEQKISKHLKLDKKSTIYLTGGKHIGEIGIVEDIVQNKIIYRNEEGNVVETSKKYAFVVGENKPAITIR